MWIEFDWVARESNALESVLMRILLFGTGSGLSDFLSVVPEDVEIVGLSDNDVRKQGKTILGHSVYAPDSIANQNFDFVVVTARAGEAIRTQLVNMGIERERILLYCSNFDADLRTKVNEDMEALNRHLKLGLHPISLCTMPVWPQSKLEVMPSEDDFCRMMSMRLAAERIVQKNVPGAIAELGVYRGELAAVLNQLFPDRTLYLFDTFEGFSGNDLSDGVEGQHSQAAVGDFKDTNLDLVLSRMAYPEKVEVRKGYFPATAEGLEESFALVSLDVDLYKPTIAGLNYFYPRLAKGGCIFIHDYNNRRYKGVRSAVEEFTDTAGVPLVQLPDFAGTAILPK
jgi:O-methyltransferase